MSDHDHDHDHDHEHEHEHDDEHDDELDEDDWDDAGHAWSIPADVTYLNHGSFGPSPIPVQDAREAWSAGLESQPMDFYLRYMEDMLDEASAQLGDFVGCNGGDLVFVDNATVGMNIVAANVELSAGDEVLVTDHEYGAVLRIWREACRKAGAELVVGPLPEPFDNPHDLADAFLENITERTKLIVVSHVTSPTAMILPVERICAGAKERGVPVCIDGPHAIGMLPLEIEKLGCDFYVVSCHKWLSAPFGSGFLYVTKRRQQGLKPVVISWGGSVCGREASWKDEFQWVGTRDPAPFLAVTSAIESLESYGLDDFRSETHELAAYARKQIGELTGLEPFQPDDSAWYGSMVAIPLPSSEHPPPTANQRDRLQTALWEEHRIEVPVIHWHGRRFVRVSCHLYNDEADIDLLVEALRSLLPS